ncbi:MAG: hypothetical protein L3K09_00730 [Thermoplasmata archaeon]|nr:hypothetical protein [Thermoplasmata archaeon]
MEYVVLKAAHPTWLTTQLPHEVAELIRYRAEDDRGRPGPGRGIAFLTRGPGVVRVVASFQAREILAVETVRNRYIAPAGLSEKLVFNLPGAVQRHLGIQVQQRPPTGLKSTDDSILWFLPAPEYYEYRGMERTAGGWKGPSPGGLAHVYLTKSILPLPHPLSELTELENRIESEEWRPRMEALERPIRSRRRTG